MNDGEPAATMADDNAILEAISRNHAEVMGRIDGVRSELLTHINEIGRCACGAAKTNIDRIESDFGIARPTSAQLRPTPLKSKRPSIESK